MLILCSAKYKSKHCLTKCFHGVPHEHETEREGNCRTPSSCSLSKAKHTITVQCKKLSRKQIKEFKNVTNN